MGFEEHTISAPDGHQIAVRFAAPEGEPRGLVQVLHGLAEHSARYARLAAALNAEGWAVLTHDHRGHGKSSTGDADLGHFADHDGWRRVVEDVRLVRAYGREQVPEGPLMLFGHSMGSYIALSEQVDVPGTVDRLVLSGSSAGGGLLQNAGLVAAKLETRRQGKRGRSNILHGLSFGSFNKEFEPTKTEFDWLSRDPDEVALYIDDPLCGFRGTNQLWVDLIGALLELGQTARLARLPPDFPIYIFSGDKDPVGESGKGVRKLADKLREAGSRNVDLKLYRDGRHEMLNETNRDEVTQDLIAWLSS